MRRHEGNAKDVCVLEAKAARTKTEEEAEAAYKDTPKAREHAAHEIAEADYKVAKERCDDKTGNDKDVCVKEAKAAMTKAAGRRQGRRTSHRRQDGRQPGQARSRLQGRGREVRRDDRRAKSACVAHAKAHYVQV